MKHKKSAALTCLWLCMMLQACDGDLESNAMPAASDMKDSALDMSAAPDLDGRVDMDADMTSREDAAADLDESDGDMSDAGSLDMPSDADMTPVEEFVPMIVGQGRFGRTITSCDGGKSWHHNRDMVEEMHPRFCGVAQPGIRCGQGEMCTVQKRERDGCETTSCGCDHLPGSATGLTYGNGWFIATFGWGTDGLVWRSQDGVSWEDVSYSTATHAGGAFGNDLFILASQNVPISTDNGQTWSAREYADRVPLLNEVGEKMGNVRKSAFFDVDGGVFMMWGDGGATVSRDNGTTWEAVEGWKGSCSDRANGAVAAHGTIVMTYGGPEGKSSSLCVSTDGARTFQTVELEHFTVRSLPVYAQGKFHVWTQYYQQGSHHYSSVDGMTWTHEPIEGAFSIGKAVYDPVAKTFVTIDNDYAEQRYLYSEDGTTWLEGSAEVPDDLQHNIRYLIYGQAPAGTPCP